MWTFLDDCVVIEDRGQGPHVDGVSRWRMTAGIAEGVVANAYGRWLALPTDDNGERARCEPVIYCVDPVSGSLVPATGVRVTRDSHYSDGTEVYRVAWVTPDHASRHAVAAVECALCWQLPALSPDESIAAHDATRRVIGEATV